MWKKRFVTFLRRLFYFSFLSVVFCIFKCKKIENVEKKKKKITKYLWKSIEFFRACGFLSFKDYCLVLYMCNLKESKTEIRKNCIFEYNLLFFMSLVKGRYCTIDFLFFLYNFCKTTYFIIRYVLNPRWN